MHSLRNSSVREYIPWNSCYFPMEMFGIQASPMLALRGGRGQRWGTIIHGAMDNPAAHIETTTRIDFIMV